MTTPSTSTVDPLYLTHQQASAHSHRWLDALHPRDHRWSLVIVLIVSAVVLGGCHARSGSCHVSSCGSDTADGVVAAFYLFYIVGWMIVAASGG